MKFVNNSNLDNTGISLANCEMARSTNEEYMFTLDQNCHNGRPRVQDQLEIQYQIQKRWADKNLKYLTFSEINSNHRFSLMIAKPLDTILLDHLQKIEKDINSTITILLSDHGNLVSDLMTNFYPEGYVQRFNPVLFIIFPQNWEDFFSSNQMKIMEENQNRLVTIRELHYFISNFIDAPRTYKKGKTTRFGFSEPSISCSI